VSCLIALGVIPSFCSFENTTPIDIGRPCLVVTPSARSSSQRRSAMTSATTGRRRVPVAFGWHPYLRVPGTPRARWRLRLPPREHRALDARSIPTGASTREPSEREPVGRRTFDDLYGLGSDRRFAFEGEDGRAIEMRCVDGYPFGQVWVPAGRSFGALEPMAAPTNALVEGTTPLVGPGGSFTARFSLTAT
jgi:galactose mutarotase-like enzyme